MIVAKFGGTSLGTIAGFRARAPIVRERSRAGCLVVASAMAGVSRALLQLVWTAQTSGAAATADAQEELLARHRAILDDAVADAADRRQIGAAIEAEGRRLAEMLAADYRGGRIPLATRDRVLAIGELLSSRLLAAILRSDGLEATWIDPRDLVVSDETFGSAHYDAAATQANVDRRLRPLIRPGHVVVTGGFIARSKSGATTTLGWGASDTSATLLGASTDASLVEIWTDVNGIATADPRVVEGARTIPNMSFEEASDLTYFGAQVLHYSSIAPARDAGIRLRVRSSFDPAAEGTLIEESRGHERARSRVCGVSLAGPMSAADAACHRGCGVAGGTSEPPWALVKGRSFPHDSVDGPEEATSILALVGADLDASRELPRIRALMPDLADERATACSTHRAYLIPASRGTDLLRAVHEELFPAD